MKNKGGTKGDGSELKLSLAKEEAELMTVVVPKATYSIEKVVRTEKKSHDLTLRSEHIDFEEIEIGREISVYPEIRYEGDTTIIPVVKEVEIITTKLILVKELHIKKVQKSSAKEVEIETRFEALEIKKDVL